LISFIAFLDQGFSKGEQFRPGGGSGGADAPIVRAIHPFRQKDAMASTRIIVLFNLKPGRVAADYEVWARRTDLPTVNALGSMERFEVFRTTGLLGSEAAPPYQYIEVLDIADMARFGADVGSDAMKQIAAEFQDWADPIFITTERIEA
jgi:hypothetical protein